MRPKKDLGLRRILAGKLTCFSPFEVISCRKIVDVRVANLGSDIYAGFLG